jgi:hypothetical protein
MTIYKAEAAAGNEKMKVFKLCPLIAEGWRNLTPEEK